MYRVLLFDLFRTVLLFDPAAPTGRVTEPTWRSAMDAVRTPAARLLPDIAFEDLLDALIAVHRETVERYPPEYHEVASHDRYRRALLRLGVRDGRAAGVAEQLSLLQMSRLSAHTYLPDGYLPLLRDLARDRRLALVSNFDHGPTVRALLARDRLDEVFEAILISVEFGRRKPHPAIFRGALDRLGASPSEALHIGDAYAEDVAGARAAGIDVAWVNPKGAAVPGGGPRPTYTIDQLTDLRTVLAEKPSRRAPEGES